MNARWIIPAFAAVTAGVLACWVTRHAVCRPAVSGLDRLRHMSFLTRELDLSSAQVDDLRRLHVTLGERLSDCCRRHCAARMRLGEILAGETNGITKAEAALTEMCLAYEQSERTMLNHILAVCSLLNEEQRRRFEEMISEFLCRGGNRQGYVCTAEARNAAP